MRTIPKAVADILELARWAPSGDNTQPWRFEVIDERHVAVHTFDTRDHCVYDLDGRSSQIAVGTLLETLAIAASAHGLRADISRRPESPDTRAVFWVELTPDAGLVADPLLPAIRRRSVQRRPMRTTPLGETSKHALQEAIGDNYRVLWFEGWGARSRLAGLMFDNARLRLTLPEAYTVHRDIIQWQARFSETRVPDRALGLDAGTLLLMRWVMGSWARVRFFNTWLAGHLIPRIEMDWLPGIFCAAHFALVARDVPRTLDDHVATGRAIQRFWLTATQLGLQLQPELTPLIFGRYVRDGRVFSRMLGASDTAAKLGDRLQRILGATPLERVAFLGRIGNGRAPSSRSLRIRLDRLLHR